jgi:putrescine transport system permease protein
MKKFSWFNATSLTFGFVFLYLPMLMLIIYSFNESRLVTVWAGFSTKWYVQLWSDVDLYARLIRGQAHTDA